MNLGSMTIRRPAALHGLGGTIRLESLVVLLLLILALSLASPYFLSVSNALNILLATSVIGILGFSATFVIAAAGIDLSVGSVLGFGGVAGALAVNALHLPWPAGILVSLLAGALCGLVNGLLITRARVPAFIVTLGMLGVARGAALVLTNGQPVYGLPAPMVWLGQGRPFGVPVPAIIFLGVAAITHFVLSRTRFGKYALVIGDNQNAARATGIHVERHLVALYTLSGFLAGLAGLVSAARVNSGDPTAGTGYELAAITAAILGGTNLFGGRASVVGTLIGALIMGVLQNGLNLLAVSSFYQQMAIGAVLVLAVWLDQLNRGRGRA
ncbi:MAG TPA: ABC transporter permease [Acetobacteraceae bacterium]|nr:ABC transporter permease [Acetobacteraceae bacterium]